MAPRDAHAARLPRLTVVVSTFDRPDALTCALRSLVRQTFRDWIALVIGDCCDPRTEKAVRDVGDARLRYLNLPERCGDQSGPNSIGAALASSPYLAFLNHDDLLLPDHLERALGRLDETGADVCFAQVLRVSGTDLGDAVEPRFVATGGKLISTFRAFPPAGSHAYEPASAWLLRAPAYARVGEWRDGFDLFRSSVNDWILRACRAGLKSCATELPTVVQTLAHNEYRGPGGVYRVAPAVQEALDRDLEALGADAFREQAERRAPPEWRAHVTARVAWHRTHFGAGPVGLLRVGARRIIRPLLPALLSPLALLYRLTGLDAYTGFCLLIGRRRGFWKRWALTYRTETGELRRADRQRLLDAARAGLGKPELRPGP